MDMLGQLLVYTERPDIEQVQERFVDCFRRLGVVAVGTTERGPATLQSARVGADIKRWLR